MAKKKPKPGDERRAGSDRRAKEKTARLLPQNGGPGATNGRAEIDALRASVGRGTLAEHALDAIAAAIDELEQIYVEVAAVGKSLALAREQLAEQEAELEAVRDSGLLEPSFAAGEPPVLAALDANDGASPEDGPGGV